MTRANINFVYQNVGEQPRTLFHYENGDQYPTGMRDYFHVLDFTDGDFTPERFKEWIAKNYKQEQTMVTEFTNGVSMQTNEKIDNPAEPEDLGEGAQPKIYYTDGFITDYSYVFSASNYGEPTILVYSWAKLIFEGNPEKFKTWLENYSDDDSKPKVVIEVSGGVAEVTEAPDNVEVKIIDHDNEEG